MPAPTTRWWTRPLLGVGFGVALTLALCTEPPSDGPRPASASRTDDPVLGLAVRTEKPTDRWTFGHANWDQSVDESARHDPSSAPHPAADSWRGMDVGMVTE